MLKLFGTTIVVAALSVSSAYAAPVSGYGDALDAQFAALYAATLAACGPGAGDADACAAAINAYSAALVSEGVPLEIASASFQELRDEVRTAGGSAAIDAVFEQLLPETESVGTEASPS